MSINELLERLFGKLEGWLESAVTMLPNVVVAIVIVVAFAFAASWLSRGLERALGKVVHQPQIVNLLVNIFHIAILAAGIFTALSVLNLDKAVTSLLAGVGIVGLALGFAFQDIAANFVSGIIMAIRHPFAIDDLVKLGDFFGRVDTIDLRATRMTLLSGETVIIPNKDVFQSAIVNYTQTPSRRVEVPVGVSYGDDLRKAKKLAIDAVMGVEGRDSSRDVDLVYTEFGDSSINFLVRFWIDNAGQKAFLHARSEAIMSIKEAFDTGEITIPFPIRTLDFGIVGGETLRDHLPLKALDQDAG